MRTVVLVLISLQLSRGAPASSSVTLHGITDTLKPEDEKFAKALSTAADAFKEAEALLDDAAFVAKRGWNKESATEGGDIVYGKDTPHGKMVTVSTVLEGHVDAVMKETWTGVSGLPDWNPNINFASSIVSLTDHADIITYGNNDVLIVTGREFVSARMYRPIADGGYIMASRSVDVDSKPESEDKVRAHLHLAAVVFRPHPEDKAKTTCTVVMLVDLKGLLPQLVVNQVVPKIMVMDIEQNVKHFKQLAGKSE
ncbi:hypothetical protein PMAYCL1PPCAC_16882 [Pristionchus mayeri]|uniref:START domain-containing protein n=1 Tax=Pristionchus mayeri TaxID=1317129 RepID=A0AAN5CLQ0_9BILA|nr:hypothetical protein PMAYCL1PPCAC_16882 [Pristionchus mayeri]